MIDNMAIPSAMVAITSATHDLNVVQTTQQSVAITSATNR